MQINFPIIFNVPHASTFIPREELKFFYQKRLQHELTVMTDHYCDDLFNAGFDMVQATVSRLVCDTERFRADADEIMSNKGMGAVYTACSDGNKLRRISEKHREDILCKYYDPYHKCLTEMVEGKLKVFNTCLIIDGHSFYPSPLPYEYDQKTDRSDICIGTDDYHTPGWLLDYIVSSFAGKGYTVSINSPFAGTMVPIKYYGKDKRVLSVMIEINRRLYIDENINRTVDYLKLKTDIDSVVNGLLKVPEMLEK